MMLSAGICGYVPTMSVIDHEQTALDVFYPARPSQLAAIRHAVEDVARRFGADDTAVLRINLAVGEAATNVIVHAYRDRPAADAGPMRLVVRAGGSRWLAVHVQDDGMGLIPRSDSPGLGLGLCLMAHETDRFEIRGAPGGGTEVVLRFRI